MLLGHRTVCAVEIEPFCRKVLFQRQRDGILPWFPIWDDVKTFDGKPWRGLVDIVCGGFPCQDLSCAGKGAGITGSRSGLWSEMARIIGEVRPQYAFVENVPTLVGRGLALVLSNLADMGYDAKWCVLGADDVGAPHRRKRVWIVGYTAEVSGEEIGSICGGTGSDTGRGHYKYEHTPDDATIDGTSSPHAQRECSGAGLREDGPEQDGDKLTDGVGHAPNTPRRETHPTEPGGFHAEPCGEDSDVADSLLPGSQRRGELGEPEAGRTTETGSGQDIAGRDRGWSTPWPEVASRLCRVDDELAVGMERTGTVTKGEFQ